jgi:hypothetical protein
MSDTSTHQETRMQAKDIPDFRILNLVRVFNEGGYWCLTYDLEELLPDYPPKVILAKCRSLIRRGRMAGCTCGCRGDFYLDGYGWG